jgi:toxin ParE1/3/4
MLDYELTPDAEEDLLEIGRYTIATWGVNQASRYETALKHCLGAVRRNEKADGAIPHRPELRSSRCKNHYIFALFRGKARPVILGVLHEKMDLLARLRERIADSR